jgi:arylsulfatase A-like enzyme
VSEAAARLPLRRVALLAASCALWTSLVEMVPVLVAPYGGVVVRVPRDFAWMIPAGNLLFFGLLAALLVAGARAWPRAGTRPVMVGALAGLATFAVGSVFERLHPLAVLILAIGVGVQVGRRASPPPRRPRLLPRAALVALLLVGGLNARIVWREQVWRQTWEAWLPIHRGGTPDIVLVILDTVRGTSLSFLGEPGPQSPWPAARTPVLDSLARTSVVFARAVAPSPWTLPSHASMFTGRWPTELWGENRKGAEWAQGLDGRYPTVAEALARAGYLTGGFVGNLAFTAAETGLSRGFLKYRDYPRTLGQIVVSTALGRRVEASGLWRRPLREHELLNRKPAAAVVDEFLAWRRGTGGTPYFAFLNFFDAHEPVFPPDSVKEAMPAGSRWDDFHHFAGLLTGTGALRAEKWTMDPAEGATHAAAYNDGITRMDAEVGRLLRTLARDPGPDNTVVVIASDHGEQLGEHGLYDHNNSLYLPALHVPLLVVDPRLDGPVRVSDVVSLRDVGATLLEWADVDAARAGIEGASLSRYWRGAPAEAEPAFATLSRGSDNQPWYPVSWGPAMYALVEEGHHYILNGDGSEELYDVTADPREEHNLADAPEAADILARLRGALGTWVANPPALRQGPVAHPLAPAPPR